MAKKFKNRKCIHCLQDFSKLTSDHVFPKSWYPSTTPEDIEKWQAPCCQKCNNNYSKIENNLLQIFALCMNPELEATQGIVEKVKRSYNPLCARSEKDAAIRKKTKEKLVSGLIPREKIKVENLLPSKQPVHNTPYGIAVPEVELKKMAEKIIRGIVYVMNSSYIDSSYKIDVYIQDEIDAAYIHELLNAFGEEYSCGKGIVVERAVLPEDVQSGVYYIVLWETVYMYAIVSPLNASLDIL